MYSVFSSGGNTKPSSSSRRSSEGPSVKERSSRLRQVKSSYRRFLSMNSATTAAAPAGSEGKGRSMCHLQLV